MKYKTTSAVSGKIILENDHYVAVPFDCSALTALVADGIIPAGTVVPSNDENAKGVLLSDVRLADNPNGTIVVHGFIHSDKLPAALTDEAKDALKLISFM